MIAKQWIGFGSGLLAAVTVATLAVTDAAAEELRTYALATGIYQSTNSTGALTAGSQELAGHDLVNLALGADLGMRRVNQVLALAVTCDLSTIKLVVFDTTTQSELATIATNTSRDVIEQQDHRVSTNRPPAKPNHVRFVAQMDVVAAGTAVNGLTGGYLTMAGRLYINPTTGCPRTRLVDTDRRWDALLGDRRIPNRDNPREHDARLAGRAHCLGVIDTTIASTNRTVLLPLSYFDFHRMLASGP